MNRSEQKKVALAALILVVLTASTTVYIVKTVSARGSAPQMTSVPKNEVEDAPMTSALAELNENASVRTPDIESAEKNGNKNAATNSAPNIEQKSLRVVDSVPIAGSADIGPDVTIFDQTMTEDDLRISEMSTLEGTDLIYSQKMTEQEIKASELSILQNELGTQE